MIRPCLTKIPLVFTSQVVVVVGHEVKVRVVKSIRKGGMYYTVTKFQIVPTWHKKVEMK
jgi:hypothetical protein